MTMIYKGDFEGQDPKACVREMSDWTAKLFPCLTDLDIQALLSLGANELAVRQGCSTLEVITGMAIGQMGADEIMAEFERIKRDR